MKNEGHLEVEVEGGKKLHLIDKKKEEREM